MEIEYFLVVEDTPEVEGQLVSERVFVSNKDMIHELDLKGYGDIDGSHLLLQPFESLYLLYSQKLTLKKGNKKIDFDMLMSICQNHDNDILTKFLIYRDLRNRGYVAKDGFGFGSDFRVYERGQFREKGAKFLIFGLNEGQQQKMGALQKKIDEITKMGKEPVIAVIERRGEVIYYKINKMNFYQNNLKENSVPF